MKDLIKRELTFLYWLPAITRAMWKVLLRRFFVFREEPSEFLRFLEYWYLKDGPSREKNVEEFFRQAMDEIAMRKRRGDWFPEEEGQRPC